MADLQAQVQAAADEMVAAGTETGLQVAVHRHGRVVADVVSGLADPQALPIQTRVNGEVRQNASTGDMIFNVAETISWISRFITLQPGDVIATGTPSGVGATTETFLKAGDVVEVEVDGLGVLRNQVVDA